MDSGIRCQLLNPVEEEEILRFLRDDRWCLQEKFDGRRMLIRKAGVNVTAINRRGLFAAIPASIEQSALKMPFDFLIDGEAVGGILHAFDLLELRGTDLRSLPYRERLARLARWIPMSDGILAVRTTTETADKLAMFHALELDGREGAVAKDLNAVFSPERPTSGGNQLKFKFVETASFIVGSVHPKKRSIGLNLIASDGDVVPAGNVTIPPNHEIPSKGAVVEVRYLYAFRESGSVYQPVYLGARDDIEPAECSTSQLKFKQPLRKEAA